jgi:hypothetical protein
VTASVALTAGAPGAALGVRLERGELPAPEGVDLGQPALQPAERLRPQPVEAHPRVVFDPTALDQPAPAQHAQVPTHRRHAQPTRLGQLARPPRPAPQVVDDPPADGGGEFRPARDRAPCSRRIVNLCG